MAVEREMSPQERGATLQGLNGKEIAPEAAEKILGVLDSTIDQFLAAKQAQKIEKDLPTRVLADGTKEWRNETGLFHRGNGPAIEFSDGRLLYFQNGALHRSEGPAVINTDGSRLYFLNDKQVQEREIIPARIRDNGVKEWHNEKGELHREYGPAFTHPDGTEGWHRNGVMHREGGPAFTDGLLDEQRWYRDGKLHREDGPAVVINSDRYVEDNVEKYYREGVLHREDGPAIIYEDGSREYYQKGLLHRENGPARVEIADNVAVSYAEYRIRGELHREDGPAIERDTGEKEYYRHGKLHREDGPAIERPDGTKEYYLNGEKTTAAELCKSLGISSSAQTESRTPETLEKAATEDLRIAKESFPQHFQSEKNKAYLENARKTNEFMDRPLPPGNGAAREYCVEARKAIALNGQWPGKSADENIAQKLLQQGHDKSKIVEAIRGKSPEMVGRNLNESRAYAKELVDRALTPEVKKERQRGVSRDR